MIVINNPEVREINHRYYIYCEVIDNGEKKLIYWGGVEQEYREYLLYERSDAFVVGLLSYAMRTGQDIKCEAPVSEELLYNIRQYLVPLVTKYGNNLYPVNIDAQTVNEKLPCGNMVGAAASCGVDSFNSICNQLDSLYKSMNITHLCLNNVGAYNECYGDANTRNRVKNERYNCGEELAKELGLPIIITESNFAELFEQNHLYTNTYSSMFSVLNMRKAWRVYYYSSAYHDIGLFSLFDNERKDTSYYDLLTLNCLSTDGIRIYSEGGDRTRLGKVRNISDFEPAQKYLHVCINKETNCGICEKCKRTLLCLDIVGKLDEFKNVFDVEYYKRNKKLYMEWFYIQNKKYPLENADMHEVLKDYEEYKEVDEGFKQTVFDIMSNEVLLYGIGVRGKRLYEWLQSKSITPVIIDNEKDEAIKYEDFRDMKDATSYLCIISPEKYYYDIREEIERDYPKFSFVSYDHINMLVEILEDA